jgi:hypothetical protein
MFLLLILLLLFLLILQKEKKKKKKKKHAGETPTGRKGKMPSPRRPRQAIIAGGAPRRSRAQD